MPTRRQERVAKRIVQESVDALRNLKHASLGFLTVTKCEVSPDLRHAKIFISVLGDDAERERVLRIVRNNAPRLRGMIGSPLGLKTAPDLHFALDDSIANADRIGRLIRDARETDPNPGPLPPEDEAAILAAAQSKQAQGIKRPAAVADPFEAVRLDVEDELLGEDVDDPYWRPVNLDELPDDADEDGGDKDDG
ncbi:MAG: 30S ribosome-binding factor RbfA [Planctomycetota bacterium]|jgi:ribosome-binding factor A|nr:30S ribosome-binding factor RbfA [Planctomycetota bacterium]